MDRWTYDEFIGIWKKQRELEQRIAKLENEETIEEEVQKTRIPSKKVTKIRIEKPEETETENEEETDEEDWLDEEGEEDEKQKR